MQAVSHLSVSIKEQLKHLKNKFIVDPPTGAITTTPRVTATVEETVTFECQVEGDGKPVDYKFVWSRAGDSSFSRETDNGHLDLLVTSVDQEDTYYCTPENVAGPGNQAAIILNVKSEHVHKYKKPFLYYATHAKHTF